MQKDDFINYECYKRLRTTSAISTDLSLVLGEGERVVCQSARIVTLEKGFEEQKATVNCRALFNIIYSSEEGLQCYEGGANFELVFAGEFSTENTPNRLEYEVQNLRTKVADGVVTVSAVIDAEMLFRYTDKRALVGEISGAICKKRGIDCVQLVECASTSLEIEGEKILPFLVKRLLQSEPCAIVKSAECGVNEVVLEGEILNELLILTSGGRLERESITTPFRVQVEASGAMPEMVTLARAEIADANYKIISEEDSEKSVISLTYTLNAFCEVYERVQKDFIEDAFFPEREIILDSERVEVCEMVEGVTTTKKCFGEAICALKEEERVIATLNGELNSLNYGFSEGKTNLSLVAKLNLITLLSDGTTSSCEAQLPISLTLETKNPPLDLLVSKKCLTAKQNDGKIFIEGELLVHYISSEKSSYNLVTNVSEGEEKPQDDGAINIIFIKEGEDAWSVCKKVGVDERSLATQNPNLNFPAERDCAVVVYKPTT